MSASATPEKLEVQAHAQRERIHRTALELISKVDDAKQRLTLSYNVRAHFDFGDQFQSKIGRAHV